MQLNQQLRVLLHIPLKCVPRLPLTISQDRFGVRFSQRTDNLTWINDKPFYWLIYALEGASFTNRDKLNQYQGYCMDKWLHQRITVLLNSGCHSYPSAIILVKPKRMISCQLLVRWRLCHATKPMLRLLSLAEHIHRALTIYRQISNISCTLICNIIVDHADVVGASPGGAASTTSSFST